MAYLQMFLRAVALCRVSVLSMAAFFLVQGLWELPVVHLPFWLNLSLAFAIAHALADTARRYFYVTVRFTYTSVLTIVWILFLQSTSIMRLLVDNAYRTQSLFCGLTLALLGMYLYQDLRRTFDIFSRIKMDSRITIVGSFVLVIFFGAGLLVLPVSSAQPGVTIAPVDAFFTAASAVCVTGLTVVDTATAYSRFGQIIILILIQIGSLGLVTITAVFINLLGKSMSMRGQMSAKNSFSSRLGDNSLQQFLRFALGFTIITESALAAVLFARFAPDFLAQVPSAYPTTLVALEHAVYYSIFHAVSAFCNAGFSLFSTSLMGYRTDLLVNFTIMFAIFAGGLGFLVWQDIRHYVQGRTIKLRLQSLIALRASLALIALGTVVYFLIERHYSLKGLGFWDQMLSSLFVSVNLRTAGFNTTDLSLTSEAARVFSCVLMYIGASPGSTGGGIKTTTFAILLATIRQLANGNNDIVIAGRRINNDLVVQAWFLFVNSLIWIFFVIFLLCLIEQLPLSAVAYEVLSAYGTVGVSTGITPGLGSFSKILVASTMIIGRVGPSTIILAFAANLSRRKLSVAPSEDIAVG